MSRNILLEQQMKMLRGPQCSVTQFIGMSFGAEMSMWNSFDQLEKYMKKSDAYKPIGMLHEAAGRFGNRACCTRHLS